jgi:hypothetical protein
MPNLINHHQQKQGQGTLCHLQASLEFVQSELANCVSPDPGEVQWLKTQNMFCFLFQLSPLVHKPGLSSQTNHPLGLQACHLRHLQCRARSPI